LITLQRDDIGSMPKTASLTRRIAPLVLFAALGLGACSHSAGGDFSKPTAAATNAPMNLASPGAAPDASAQAAAAPADATPVNVGTIDAAAGAQPAPVKPKKPAKVAAQPAAEPAMAPAAFAEPKAEVGEPEKVPPVPVKTVRDDGFPNINAPPPEPSGKLLSPEERARVIAELEALKNRQGVAPQKQPAKKCTAEQIADGVKGCPAPTD
jgi:hypothetical protein